MNIPEGYKLVPSKLLEVFANSSKYTMTELNDAIQQARALDAAPTPPQPIYDEAKERELFEAFQVDEGGNIVFEDGYYENVFVQSAWDGWKACAQSRAKAGEDE